MIPLQHLAHHEPAVAESIRAVMVLAHAQEAQRLQCAGAAPFELTAAEIAARGHVHLGVVVDGEVIAVLGIDNDDEPGQRCLFDLVVHPQWQRQGLGRRLVEAALAREPGATFAVCAAAANAPALALYASLGFVAYRHGLLGTQALPVFKLRRPADASTDSPNDAPNDSPSSA